MYLNEIFKNQNYLDFENSTMLRLWQKEKSLYVYVHKNLVQSSQILFRSIRPALVLIHLPAIFRIFFKHLYIVDTHMRCDVIC